MIVVDSSMLIGRLRTPEVRSLRALNDPDQILFGDLILLEVLQGARASAMPSSSGTCGHSRSRACSALAP